MFRCHVPIITDNYYDIYLKTDIVIKLILTQEQHTPDLNTLYVLVQYTDRYKAYDI